MDLVMSPVHPKRASKSKVQKYSKKSLSIGILALCLIISGSVFLALSNILRPKPVGAELFKYTCDSSGQGLGCLELHYENVTRQQGPQAAFSELKSLYLTDASVQSNCHQLTHVIGRTEAEIAKNFADAYAHGDNFCNAG